MLKIFNQLLRLSVKVKIVNNTSFCQQCSTLANIADTNVPPTKYVTDELDLENEIKAMRIAEENSILEPCTEDLSDVGPYLRPTFNFAAYINKSEILKKLVDIGVNLYKIEKRKSAPEVILKLDFDKDVKPYINFLGSLGVGSDEIGPFISKNPYIFQEGIDSLLVRVNYLESKLFTNDMIREIVRRNPYWLMFSTKRIDTRLGHFQKTFQLTGDEVRQLATKLPSLITYNMDHIILNTFSIKEEMGFDDRKLKALLLQVPKLWVMNSKKVLSSFDYVHNTMEISHEEILKMPKILTCRKFRIEQRHRFLEKLNRAQYNPKKENYISLITLVSGTDSEFCVNVAKSSVQAFNMFLKTF